MHTLFNIIGTAGLFFASLFGFSAQPSTQPDPSFGGTLLIAGQTYYLAGSGVSSTATSITLTSLSLPQNGYKIQDSDLSDTFYITLEPGNRTKQEIVSCTTVVQNPAGTATLSGCVRGLSPVTPHTASSTLQFAHGGSTQIIFSDPPQVFNQFAAVANTTYITGAWGFQGTAPTSTICSSGTQLCNKNYVDAVTVAGAPAAGYVIPGIGIIATKAQAAAGTASTTYNAVAYPNFLSAQNSTSTCQVAQSNAIIASSTTGKIDRGCIDQTSKYSFTGDVTLANASSTNFGVLGGITLNNIGYTFKSGSRQASGTVLSEDGSGGLSFVQPSVRLFAQDGTVFTTAATATATAKTVIIPANTLKPNGLIRFTVLISGTLATNAKDFDVQFGSGAASTTIAAIGGNSFISTSGHMNGVLQANNATNAQSFYSENYGNPGGTYTTVLYPTAGLGTASVDTTAQTYLSFRYRAVSASDTASIRGITVEIVQ